MATKNGRDAQGRVVLPKVTADGSWSSATSRVACAPDQDPALLAQAAAQTATGVAQMKRLLPSQRRGLDCPARLAYRDMSDIGSKRICGNPVVTSNGFCRRHDPETAPKRDAKGRIIPKTPKTCATCSRPYDAYCKASQHPVAS